MTTLYHKEERLYPQKEHDNIISQRGEVITHSKYMTTLYHYEERLYPTTRT
jgi:hypothetical protein